ncbi:hypothetical protein BDV93DRAFT_556870 [Ceratobasidium sp. AG-I]|nr:hypothetical protein BDV93DRAFT_556870 [Ceratobasidium sp. AG-I]
MDWLGSEFTPSPLIDSIWTSIALLLAPEVDHEVRWCMLKLADLIYCPADEPPVKIKIVIPSTPVSELPPPPPTPSITLALPKKPLPLLSLHEADGTPYEHVLDLRDGRMRSEVPFNTKYERVRRRRRGEVQVLEPGVQEGENREPGALVLGAAVFEYAPWEDPTARTAWHVEEFEDSAEQPHTGPVPFNTAAVAGVMWASQLARERDVGAQLEAVWAFGGSGGLGESNLIGPGTGANASLGASNAGLGGGPGGNTSSPGAYSSFAAISPSGAVSTALAQTVLVPTYFFRVRCAAARALASQGAPGLFHLLKIWTRWCYEPGSSEGGNGPAGDGFAQRFIPKPNDFSDFQEYFVRKAVVGALARVRDNMGGAGGGWIGGTLVRGTVVDQLVYNDNSGNTYSDDMYVATLISALAASLIPPDAPERNELLLHPHAHSQHPNETELEEAIREGAEEEENAEVLRRAAAQVERYRARDRLVPSRHNVVSVAVVEWYLTIMMSGLVNNDPRLFLAYSQEANATGLRLASFDALLLMKWWRTKSLIQYIFAVIAHDPSRQVRRHVARSVITGLAVLYTVGDLRPPGKDEPMLLIEEDGSGKDKDKERVKKGEGEMLVKALKKEVGRSKQMRDSIMPIMLAPEVDHEVRWCMLQLADLIYRPADEPPVKIKIVIPLTPVSELPPPPPTPSITLALPKKPLPPVRQTPTPTLLKLSLPKLKLVSPRPSSPSLPPFILPIAPSPLSFESTPGKNGISLPEEKPIPKPIAIPAPKPKPKPVPIIEEPDVASLDRPLCIYSCFLEFIRRLSEQFQCHMTLAPMT